MYRFSKIGFAALAITMAVAGCNERPPRSFVQPNVIKKSDLLGANGDAKWYYVQTVTEAPVTSSFMFNGNSSELMKIKFDIQENTLFARRAYEQIEGSEDAYKQDPAKYAGQPVAAWPIQSQFDIIRDYNATTGEETNKIIESTERPWNEREFIRVDWSNNVLTPNDVIGVGINFLFADNVSVQPGSYWESDPTKPDAFRMERADEKDADEFEPGEANYLDVTNKWVINPTPKTVCYEDGGQNYCFTYPSCFFGYQLDDCASQIVKVRHAFAKISPRHDYQPRKWDGKQMEMFGIWDVGLNRLTYNRQYGVTNTGFKRHAARFNLWKKSYQEDGKTPIPYAQREQRTTPYYASSSDGVFPPELFDVGKEVVRQWNEAIKCAVADVQGKLTAEGACDTSQVQDVFVWCHNPVKIDEDPPACAANIKPELDAKGEVILGEDGHPKLVARQGDPRRSHIFWVNQQQNSGPLGYGPPLFDIETGETISGQAYIYGAAIDSYAARSRDLVMLLLGKIDPGSFIEGVDVRDWVRANRAGAANASKVLSKEEVAKNVKAMDFSWARGLAPEAPIDTSNLKNFIASMKQRQDAIYKTGIYGHGEGSPGQILRNKLRGTRLEGMMVTPDLVAAVSGRAGTDWHALGDAEKARISPLRSAAVRRVIEERMDRMRAFGYDFADFADEGIAQRAIQLANDPAMMNADPEIIRQKLRRDIFLGVTLHEMGHNVGLRHNFRASYDSMNYYPQYWQLRDAAAKNPNARRFTGIDPVTQQITSVPYAGGTECDNLKGKLRPRYVDCPGGATSVDEIQGLVREYQYSSIMDYGSEFNMDFHGLGKYDKAAMKFSYAGDGFVEVFTDAKQDQNSQLKWAAISAFQGALGFPSPIGLTATLESINYTTYPDLFQSGIEGFEMRKDVPYSEICGTSDDYACPLSGFLRSDRDGNVLVPYYFCSDEFAGNLTCQRFDSGADVYEQAMDVISRYENYYLLNNFKRDKYNFYASLAYLSRIEGRYFRLLRTQMTWYTLLRANFEEFFDQTPEFKKFWEDENGWGSFGTAVAEGFNMFGRVLARPQAGQYTLVAAGAADDYPGQLYKQSSDSLGGGLTASNLTIGLIDGKFIDTTWEFDRCGYYWADECQSRIGYFLDKTLALDVLADNTARFTGYDTAVDVRKYAIGYSLAFQQQVEEKVGAILSGDYASWAPRLEVFSTDYTKTKIALRNWTTDPNPGNTDSRAIIDPSAGFTLQLYTGVYGLSEFPTSFNRSFIDKTRIFVVGNGEAPVPDSQLGSPGACTAAGYVCVDDVGPTDVNATGKKYAAKHYPDGTFGPLGAGERMLNFFQTLINNRNTACGGNPGSTACSVARLAVEKYRQNIEVMRSLHAAFGYGIYKSDAPFLY